MHVPYRGTAPMLTAAVAGEVQVVADPMTTILPHIQSGKLRAIAIAGPTRTDRLPGRADHRRAGLSQDQLAVLARRGGAGRNAGGHRRQAQCRVPRSPQRSGDASSGWPTLGAEIKIGTPDDFEKMLARELALWTGVVKDANITVE